MSKPLTAQYVLRYPTGKLPVAFDDDGNPTEYKDNYDIACETMEHFLEGGSIILPHPTGTLDGLPSLGWEIEETGPFAGFDWDWVDNYPLTEKGKRWKITDVNGKEYQNVMKLNSSSGLILQRGEDGPVFVRTLAPLPITVEQVPE